MNDLRADVRAATDRRCVAKHFCRLLDRCDDALLDTGRTRRRGQIFSATRERARADQRSGPRAKVFRTETLAHHLLDVLVDMPARHWDQLAVSILKLEHIKPR